MALARDSIPKAAPASAVVECSLGEVDVVGMDLEQLPAFLALRRSVLELQEGETEEAATNRAMGKLIPVALSMCVVADDGQPVYTEDEWRAWCRGRVGESYALFNAALQVSGAIEEQQKKT